MVSSCALSRSIIGMTFAHIAVAMLVLGVASVESYTQERDVAAGPGDTITLGNYAFRFDRVESIEGPNYEGVRGHFTVTHEGRKILDLHPEKRLYWVQRQTMTEAGNGSYWGSNVFLALGDDVGAGKWSVRMQIRPLVNYVWISAFLMALGGAELLIYPTAIGWLPAEKEELGAAQHCAWETVQRGHAVANGC